MATVYLARLEENGTESCVALKKPHAYLASDPATLAILEDEARIGASIDHPNVVRVVDFIRGNDPALVMEWIDGVDLAKVVRAAAKSGRRLPIDVVAAIARDVLAGLHAAHETRNERGVALRIVHRDVSPHNVLLGFDGVARVTDFGVAMAAGRQHHTEHGAIKGKLAYLAPEQLEGHCDRRADVFAAGAMIWELLTGVRLRSGLGVEMLVEILCGSVRAPSSVIPSLAYLDELVMRALARSPEARFATAADMLDALEHTMAFASRKRVAAVLREILGAAELADEAVAAEAASATDAANAPTIALCRLPPRSGSVRERRFWRRTDDRRAFGEASYTRRDARISFEALRDAIVGNVLPHANGRDVPVVEAGLLQRRMGVEPG